MEMSVVFSFCGCDFSKCGRAFNIHFHYPSTSPPSLGTINEKLKFKMPAQINLKKSQMKGHPSVTADSVAAAETDAPRVTSTADKDRSEIKRAISNSQFECPCVVIFHLILTPPFF